MNKIKKLPNANTNTTAASVDNLRRELPFLIEHTVLIAKLRMASYKAYLAEGFTEEQALDLCKH